MLLGAWAELNGLEGLGEQERCLGAMLLYLCPHMFVQSHGGSSRPWSGWLPAFWDGFGTAQTARLEERSGMDGAGGVRLFFPQHFCSVVIWRCWCSCNLGLQETSAKMWIKYWGKIFCIRVGLSFWPCFSSFLLSIFPVEITGKSFSSWNSGKTHASPRAWAFCTYKRCLPCWGYQVLSVGCNCVFILQEIIDKFYFLSVFTVTKGSVPSCDMLFYS